MTAVDELVTWLREQIAEDRRIATEAGGNRWLESGESPDSGYAIRSAGANHDDVVGPGHVGGGVWDATSRDHIVRHDPRAVLTQCDAHEAILDGYAKLVADDAATKYGDPDARSAFYQYEEVVLPALALAYQHRPGYRDE